MTARRDITQKKSLHRPGAVARTGLSRRPALCNLLLLIAALLLTATPGRGQSDHHQQANAVSLFHEGQQLEKSGQFTRAIAFYQQALSALSRQKHDLKFHLKIETALSRVKAKAGINQ